MKIPTTPISIRLSGSAKETELRIRNIFQWKKKRPPVVLFVLTALVVLLCFSLFSCQMQEEPPVDAAEGEVVQTPPTEQTPVVEQPPAVEQTPPAETVPPADPEPSVEAEELDWAGNGYLYYSPALELFVELPPEWFSTVFIYDHEGTVRIDAITGWDTKDPDNGRLATVYKFSRQDWDTQSGAYKKGMFEGGPAVQILTENEQYVCVMKRYGGLIGFENMEVPGFQSYKQMDESLKNGAIVIYPPTDYDDPPWHGASESAAVLEACRAALLNESGFIRAATGERITMEQLQQTLYDGKREAAVKPMAFAVADLDDDGLPEVVVQLSVYSTWEYLILHYQEGEVYAYSEVLRGLMGLKADGTFHWSDGAFDNGTGRIRFAEYTYTFGDQTIRETHTTDRITYCKSGGYDAEGNLKKYFFVDRQPATVQEYTAAEARHEAKPDAAWYDFTEENINTLLTE